MKSVSALVVAFMSAIVVDAQAPARNPCTAPEYRQFDFWIGDWDVFTPDGKLAGHNRVERIEGGCGLQENWIGAGGGTGRSINTFSPADKQWHQFWLSSAGVILNLAGTFADGALTLGGTTASPTGAAVENRLRFTPHADGTVRQFWQISRDGGMTWTTTFDGKYVRKVSSQLK